MCLRPYEGPVRRASRVSRAVVIDTRYLASVAHDPVAGCRVRFQVSPGAHKTFVDDEHVACPQDRPIVVELDLNQAPQRRDRGDASVIERWLTARLAGQVHQEHAEAGREATASAATVELDTMRARSWRARWYERGFPVDNRRSTEMSTLSPEIKPPSAESIPSNPVPMWSMNVH